VNAILDELIEKKIDEINKNGYVVGGHNGPYYDDETPVRNTSHVAVILSYYYKKTGNPYYYEALLKCGEYLLSNEARPHGKTFYCRKNTNKDRANGIIGQAWVIEGLLAIYNVTKNKSLIDLAKEIFIMVPFDEKVCAWRILDIDGEDKGFDMTFNHQLWFAAAGIQILYYDINSEIKTRCDLFLNNINSLITCYPNGLISHFIKLSNLYSKFSRYKNGIKSLAKLVINKNKLYYKENGYHLFNMYAFALIKNFGYDFSYINTKQFKKNLDYCYSSKINSWLMSASKNYITNMPKVKNFEINIYGYGYNAPGFELPYVTQTFMGKTDKIDCEIKEVVETQIRLTYDSLNKGFYNNNDDWRTLEARIYEYIRYLELIDKINH